MNPEGWWHRASTEQRLRQLDAGIELGLSSRAIAVCSGLDAAHESGAKVREFSRRHGRKMPYANSAHTSQKMKRVGDLKRSYWRGGRDFTDQALRHDDNPDAPLSFEDEVA